MKYSELRKSEYVPDVVYNPWHDYSDGLSEFKDKTLIRSPFSWSLKMDDDEIEKYNEKNKKLAKRRKKQQKKVKSKKGNNI